MSVRHSTLVVPAGAELAQEFHDFAGPLHLVAKHVRDIEYSPEVGRSGDGFADVSAAAFLFNLVPVDVYYCTHEDIDLGSIVDPDIAPDWWFRLTTYENEPLVVWVEGSAAKLEPGQTVLQAHTRASGLGVACLLDRPESGWSWAVDIAEDGYGLSAEAVSALSNIEWALRVIHEKAHKDRDNRA